jgi:hypothetical protein
MVYVRLGDPEQAVDERAFAVLRQFRAEQPESKRLPLASFKEVVREQYLMLRADAERAIAAIPTLLPEDAAERRAAIKLIQRVISARGEPPAEVKKRLSRIEALFEAGPAAEPAGPGGPAWKVAAAESRPPVRTRPRGTRHAEKARAT